MEELIEKFHLMWDSFTGLARLISKDFKVIASNKIAQEKGFVEGVTCTRFGDPITHRGCKMRKMFESKEAFVDNVLEDRVRGWMPIEGYDDVCVHFTVMIPKEKGR